MGKIFFVKEILLLAVGISIAIKANKIALITLGVIFSILSVLEIKKFRAKKNILDIILGMSFLISVIIKYNLVYLFIIWLIINSIYILVDYITSDKFQSIFKIVIGVMSIVLAILLVIKPIKNQNIFPVLIAVYFIVTSIIDIGIWLVERMRYN